MKIGIVVDNEFDSDHRVQKQVAQLVEANHEVFVICFDFGKEYKKYNTFKVTRIAINQTLKNILVLLSTRFFFYEKLWSSNITKFIHTHKLEAIHCHDLYMAKATKKGIQKSAFNLKLTLDLHENYPYAINTYKWATIGWRKIIVNPKKWFRLEFEYLNYADNIITLSNSFSNNLTTRFPALKTKKFVTHPNLFNFSNFKKFENNIPKVKYTSKRVTLLYFGVIAQRRGLLQIMPWLDQLLENGLEFSLLIIGPVDKADSHKFDTLLKLPNLSNHTTYLKWADISTLPYYLNKANVGLAPFEVNPQHDSGVANKLYQYMYGAMPILATACKAQKELIETAECGLIYSDSNSFKTQLKKLVQIEVLRNQLGVNGKNHLTTLYKSNVDKEFLELYK